MAWGGRTVTRSARYRVFSIFNARHSVRKGVVDDIEELRDKAAPPDAVIAYKGDHAPPAIGQHTNLPAAAAGDGRALAAQPECGGLGRAPGWVACFCTMAARPWADPAGPAWAGQGTILL